MRTSPGSAVDFAHQHAQRLSHRSDSLCPQVTRFLESGERRQIASPGTHLPDRTSAQPVEARVSILLCDALDFATDRDDGGGQTRESLSRIASSSAAVAQLVLKPLFAERKSGARIYGSHEQTEANPAQPRERLENARERNPFR